MASRSVQLKKSQNIDEFYSVTPTPQKNHYSDLKRSVNLANQQSTTCHENKLPVNLFYTAAEYNKMLITNGRSLKKKSQPQIDGYIGNLQFINDPIFQSCQQKKQSLRHKIKQQPVYTSQRKQGNSYTQDCNCCCCDQFCQLCAKQQKGHNHHRPECKSKKLNQYQLHKALQKVNSKPTKQKKNKIKVITSEVNIKKINRQKDSKGISNSQKQCSSSYLSHKSFNINNLLYKSLLQFQQKKRENRINKLMEKQFRYQHDNLMKQFDYEVRAKNRQSLSKSRSKHGNLNSKSKSNNKKVRFQYWQSIRPTISKSLLKDKIEGIKPKTLNNKMAKSAVNCNHAITLTPEMIQTLKLKHERQAKMKIAYQAYEKQQKKRTLQNKLRQLQKHRKTQANNCVKKKFQPTPQMIEQAFKNIIQQPKQPPQGKAMIKKSKK